MVVIHIAILILTGLAIVYSDHLGWQYFRGTKQTLDPVLVHRLHYGVWVGLIGMILTGVIMVAPGFSYYAAQSYFWVKMGFVALLVVNSIAITFLIGVATKVPYASLTLNQKVPLIISGGLSTLGWLGALLTALIYFG
jgi:hypothetical protein